MTVSPLSSLCRAFTLLEILAVLTILGIVAAVVIPRVSSQITNAEREACLLNQREIELQVQLWRRNQGNFPAADLAGIRDDLQYFPEELPVCPVDGTPYTIDTTNGIVTGHTH